MIHCSPPLESPCIILDGVVETDAGNLNESNLSLSFVDYLREAVLQYGGFPGVKRWSRSERDAVSCLPALVAGLKPF